MKHPLFFLILNIPCLLFLSAGPVSAQPSILARILDTRDSLVEVQAENSDLYRSAKRQAAIDPRTGRMILLQNVKKASYQRRGAGVIIHESGVIITNAHIIHKADHIVIVLSGGGAVPARVVQVINNLDLALLKIVPPFALTAVPFADSDQVRLGQEIITVGHSFLLNQTVSGGKVIGLGTRRSQGKNAVRPTDLIQTSFNLYEGDSGGPLFDQDGHLIGLMTARETTADHSSFAVPSNKIRSYLSDYLAAAAEKNSRPEDTSPKKE